MPSDLHRLITEARWFGGKGRPFSVAAVNPLGEVGSGPVTAQAWVATLDFGTEHDHYVLWSAGGDAARAPGMPDLLTDPRAQAALADGLAGGTGTPGSGGSIRCRTVRPLSPEDLGAPRPMHVEQSNTSLRLGERWLLKLFRRLSYGVNPDIELHEVLTQAGCPDIAALAGWIEADVDGRFCHLGILQEFLPGAVDGWTTALGELHSPSPEGFTPHAEALGAALARVHTILAAERPGPATNGRDLALAMTSRLEAAADIAPALRPHHDSLVALFDAVREISVIPTHRIHGDFHLGQVLLSEGRWRLVDFEGEPAAPAEARSQPDSGWRDLAGMLRSLHYAEEVGRREGAAVPAGWRATHQKAFLDGYLGRSPDAQERLLLDAYTADKAVYETVYETRHRPDWVGIPLSALAQIGAR